MTIAAILRNKGSEVVQVSANDSVAKVVALLAERRIGCVAVIENGHLTGIFSERDLIYRLGSDGPAIFDSPVSAAMTSPPVTVSPNLGVLAALSLITRRRIRHLPVVEEGRLIGLVSIGDLVKYRIDMIEAEAAAMREYIQSA